MLIEITDTAVEAVRRALESENLPAGTYLRVAVERGGCSGLSYALAFEEKQKEGDRIIEKEGVRLLVDPRSELYLAGMTLDYSGGLSGRGFVFTNPNASGTCGCGSSFSA